MKQAGPDDGVMRRACPKHDSPQVSVEADGRRSRDLQVAGFTLTPVGVQVDGDPAVDEWREAVRFVDRCQSGVMWWLGDLLAFGEATYGELDSAESGDGKYSRKSLYEAKYVAQHVPFSIRMETLSFGQPDSKELVDSVVTMEKDRTHSHKPDVFYEIIEKMYTFGPYVELFARNTRPGWEAWGNEVDTDADTRPGCSTLPRVDVGGKPGRWCRVF